MLARSTLLRRTASLSARQQRRRFNAKGSSSAHKRALSKQQLEGKKGDAAAASAATPPPTPAAAAAAPKRTAAPPTTSASGGAGGGSSTKPADVGKAASASSGSGGGGALFPLLLLGGVGVGGAYYNGLIPEEYLPGVLKSSSGEAVSAPESVKVAKELKEAVEEVAKEAVAAVEEKAAKEEAAAPTEEEVVEVVIEEEEEKISLEHPEGGSRVDIDKIATFYQTVNESRAIQAEEEARDAAAKATQYNEGEETQTETPVVDPMSALTTAANAMSELQSTSSLQNSKTLAAAKAALRSDMDAEYFKDLDSLSESELRVRVVQLATEMSDRTKWEAVRLKEFLGMKEKEVGERYMEILQKQRLEFEDLLSQRLREQEDSITRQANAALQAKEESVQSLLKATSDAREKEMKDVLTEETKKIVDELNLEYEQKLQNELAKMKQAHVAELEGHVAKMRELQSKLGMLQSKLEVSHAYESGSRRAHRVSAAALALANKLEGGEGAAVELAALRGACDGEQGVIASAVRMIPKTAEGGVPTLADLQARFDESYSVGRQAAMVPEGRAGLEGQLLGMIFAKLSVPPSPDAAPTSEEEGSVADGILSLARKYVQLGDLEKAVEQLDRLKGQTAYVMDDWKSKAADRVCTERALKVIKLECSLLNKDLVGSES